MYMRPGDSFARKALLSSLEEKRGKEGGQAVGVGDVDERVPRGAVLSGVHLRCPLKPAAEVTLI